MALPLSYTRVGTLSKSHFEHLKRYIRCWSSTAMMRRQAIIVRSSCEVRSLEVQLLVGGAGFEPAKAVPSDLQSDPFDRSGNSPFALSFVAVPKGTSTATAPVAGPSA